MYLDKYSLYLTSFESQNGEVITSGEDPNFSSNRFADSDFDHIHYVLSRVPKSSDLERILYTFNQIALNHKWPEFGNPEYVYEYGLKFHKYVGTEKELFVPRNEAPFELTGHSINNSFFWRDLSKVYDYFYNVRSNSYYTNMVYGDNGVNAVTIYGGDYNVLPVSNMPTDTNGQIDIQKMAANSTGDETNRGSPTGYGDGSLQGHINVYSSYSGALRNESYNITFNPLASGLNLYSSYNIKSNNAGRSLDLCKQNIYDYSLRDRYSQSNPSLWRGEVLEQYDILEHQNFQDQSKIHMLQYSNFCTKAMDNLCVRNLTISDGIISNNLGLGGNGLGAINYDRLDFIYSDDEEIEIVEDDPTPTSQLSIDKCVTAITTGNDDLKADQTFTNFDPNGQNSRVIVTNKRQPVTIHPTFFRDESTCRMIKKIPIWTFKLTARGDSIIQSDKSLHKIEEYLPFTSTHNLCEIHGLRTEYIKESKIRIKFSEITVSRTIIFARNYHYRNQGGQVSSHDDFYIMSDDDPDRLSLYEKQIENLNKIPDYELVYGYSSIVDGDIYSQMHDDIDNATVIATIKDPRNKNTDDLTLGTPDISYDENGEPVYGESRWHDDVYYPQPTDSVIEVLPELEMDFDVSFENIAEEIPPDDSKFLFIAFRKKGEGKEVVPPPAVFSTEYWIIRNNPNHEVPHEGPDGEPFDHRYFAFIDGLYDEYSPLIETKAYTSEDDGIPEEDESKQMIVGPIILTMNKETKGGWSSNEVDPANINLSFFNSAIYGNQFENVIMDGPLIHKNLEEFIKSFTYHGREDWSQESLDSILPCFKVIDF